MVVINEADSIRDLAELRGFPSVFSDSFFFFFGCFSFQTTGKQFKRLISSL